MNYELIKNKYGKCSSWAIWKKRVLGGKEKDGMDNITFFNTIYELVLNPNIILVGLNISGSIENEFSNFHPISKTAHDYKIRYALEDTVFWGSYMTDIIKDYEEMISGKVMSYLSKNKSFEEKNIELFEEAFTHRSKNEKNSDGNQKNYERMEFLGDAIIGAVIAAHLYKKVPGGNEGYLTKMRSKVVSREHLNELGKDLNLIKLVRTSIPTTQFGENLHGNIFEALVGAIYLDRGYAAAEKFIHKRVIKPYVDIQKLEGKVISYKSLFIEWCQKNKKQFKFNVYEDTGNDILKHFAVKLKLEEETVSKARATSKKKADEIAAKRAYYKLKKKIDNQTA